MRLIDADALKNAMDEHRLNDSTFYGVFDLIDNAPTIDSLDLDVHIGGRCCGKRQRLLDELRPKGKWIGDTDYESFQGSYEAYKCSNCGYSLHWRDYSNEYNYCPNCGAQMGR